MDLIKVHLKEINKMKSIHFYPKTTRDEFLLFFGTVCFLNLKKKKGVTIRKLLQQYIFNGAVSEVN